MDSVYKHSAKIFSNLDVCNAYHLVTIRKKDEWKTTVKTPLERFKYLVMPFGLTSALVIFQKLVNDVFMHFLNMLCR